MIALERPGCDGYVRSCLSNYFTFLHSIRSYTYIGASCCTYTLHYTSNYIMCHGMCFQPVHAWCSTLQYSNDEHQRQGYALRLCLRDTFYDNAAPNCRRQSPAANRTATWLEINAPPTAQEDISPWARNKSLTPTKITTTAQITHQPNRKIPGRAALLAQRPPSPYVISSSFPSCRYPMLGAPWGFPAS